MAIVPTNPTEPKNGYNNLKLAVLTPEIAAEGIGISNAANFPVSGALWALFDTALLKACFDTIAEFTAAAGVTVDGTLIKDGGVRLLNNIALQARNAANSANIDILKVNASDNLEWVAGGSPAEDIAPTYGAGGSMTFTSVTTTFARMRQLTEKLYHIQVRAVGTTGGTASNYLTFTLPFTTRNIGNYATGSAVVADGTSDGVAGYALITANSTTVRVYKYDASNFGLGANRLLIANFIAEKA